MSYYQNENIWQMMPRDHSRNDVTSANKSSYGVPYNFFFFFGKMKGGL